MLFFFCPLLITQMINNVALLNSKIYILPLNLQSIVHYLISIFLLLKLFNIHQPYMGYFLGTFVSDNLSDVGP
jgi:hypothetical protein